MPVASGTLWASSSCQLPFFMTTYQYEWRVLEQNLSANGWGLGRAITSLRVLWKKKKKKRETEHVQSPVNMSEHYKPFESLPNNATGSFRNPCLFWMKRTCSGWERVGSLSDTTSMRVWTDCCRTLSFTLTSLWRSWRTLSPLWKWNYIRIWVAAPLMFITSDTFWCFYMMLNKSIYSKIYRCDGTSKSVSILSGSYDSFNRLVQQTGGIFF